MCRKIIVQISEEKSFTSEAGFQERENEGGGGDREREGTGVVRDAVGKNYKFCSCSGSV